MSTRQQYREMFENARPALRLLVIVYAVLTTVFAVFAWFASASIFPESVVRMTVLAVSFFLLLNAAIWVWVIRKARALDYGPLAADIPSRPPTMSMRQVTKLGRKPPR